MHAPQVPVSIRADYRPDIDGLRAVAVLSVLLFHFSVPGFSGGFVGVDVFFVISGYLITKLIVDGMKAGTFTLSGFYVRRARRILPALFVTIVLPFGAGFLLMTPEHYGQFGSSAVAAALSVSNFYFWSTTDYFAPNEHFRPLLHTWSLGVEEQFYLFFPAFFMALGWLRDRRLVPVMTALLGLCSLFVSISLLARHSSLSVGSSPAAAFYFPISRAFEFVIGALLIWIPPVNGRRNAEVLLAIGLALIGYSVFSFTRFTLFPGAAALVPCLGAALCIHAGRAAILGSLLRNNVSAYLGRISYSLYLVHWPLFVFYRYYIFRDPTPTEYAALALASVVLAAVSYKFVEQPFRRGPLRVPNYVPLSISVFVACVIALGGHFVRTEDGLPWRINEDAKKIMGQLPTDRDADVLGSINCGKAHCEFGNLSNPDITLVIGDSQVDQYTKALSQLAPHLHFKLLQSGSCFMGRDLRSRTGGWEWEHCHETRRELTRWLANPQVTGVIHGQRWPGYGKSLEFADGKPVDFREYDPIYDAEIPDVFNLYEGFKGRVVFINASPNTNLICLTKPLYIKQECPHYPLDIFQSFARKMRAAIAGKPQFALVDPADVICRNGKCSISDDGRPLYSDQIHLSVYGARLVVPEIVGALNQH